MVLRRISILALLLGLAIVVAPVSGAGPGGTQRLGKVEQSVVRDINQLRADRGLRPLTVASGLQTAAMGHTLAMLQGGFFAHESPGGRPFWERIKRTYPPQGNGPWLVGENLFANTGGITSQEVVAGWLASPRHRAIVLSSHFREIGIAALHAPVAGGAFGNRSTWVVTADFGSRGASASRTTP